MWQIFPGWILALKQPMAPVSRNLKNPDPLRPLFLNLSQRHSSFFGSKPHLSKCRQNSVILTYFQKCRAIAHFWIPNFWPRFSKMCNSSAFWKSTSKVTLTPRAILPKWPKMPFLAHFGPKMGQNRPFLTTVSVQKSNFSIFQNRKMARFFDFWRLGPFKNRPGQRQNHFWRHLATRKPQFPRFWAKMSSKWPGPAQFFRLQRALKMPGSILDRARPF